MLVTFLLPMTPELPINLRYLEGTDNRALDLVVVIPVARCEWHLAVKLLKWMDCLFESPDIIVYCAPGVKEEEQRALASATSCTVVHATHFKDTGYFGGANNMVKGALDWMAANRPGEAMLYMEADAVPMRSGWFANILDEYRACGQPFMGDVVICELNHLTGNSVYHPNWREIAPGLAALPGPDPEWGWDSQCADDTLTRAHRAKTIQQIWRPPLPITKEWVAANIRPETFLFHQCKDGSLIDVLCSKVGLPLIPIPAQLEPSTYAQGRKQTDSLESRRLRSPGARMVAGFPMVASNIAPSTELLYVTFKRDMDFLRYSLKSVEKYAHGFSGVTIVVPESERGLYGWVKKANVIYMPEPEGKGFLWHMAMKCRADEIVHSANAILLMDADCLFWQNATPADFFVDGKPIIVRERYADLKNPNRKLWQKAVELAIGVKPEFETMVRHPSVHLREVFSSARAAVEKHAKKPFMDYVLSCQGEFPQTFAELNLLGHVALTQFRDRYSPVDYDPKRDNRECGVADGQHQYCYRRDRDKIVEVWSRGGIDRYKSDIESWLAGRVPAYFIK